MPVFDAGAKVFGHGLADVAKRPANPQIGAGADLGLRPTLSDIGQTVAANFGVSIAHGASFLPQIL